ncbi:MAG: hypothetical protein AB7O95_06445 [Geminicoccaceae bacterium]
MVGKAARGGLTAALAILLLLASTAARAGNLCGMVTIPPEIGLTCAPATEGSISIAPQDGSFAVLSRMTVRPLTRAGSDAAAWTDPQSWLRSQVTPDLAALSDLLAPLADDPDSPFAGEQATTALDTLRRALGGLSSLPLSACDEPAPIGAGEWRMRCDFTSDGLGLFVALRLVAQGEQRWSIIMRTANEQRLRHFEAIAISFHPS